MDRLREMFEPILNSLGLSVSAINGYDLPELEQALIRVNEAIRNPEQFGTLTTRAGTKSVLIDATSETKIGILPILLERKRLILDRVKELRSQERLGGLQDLIERLAPGPDKEALEQQLRVLEADAATARERERVAAQADSAAQALVVEGWQKEREAKEEAKDQLRKFHEEQLLKEEIAERKWNRRVAREPIATLVGAILLVLLTTVFVIAMFLKVIPSTLLSNSFLIILGYFFGQNTNGAIKTQAGGAPNPPSDKKTKRKKKSAKIEQP
jgi:hypothetical protein